MTPSSQLAVLLPATSLFLFTHFPAKLISQNQHYFSAMEQYFSLTTNQQQHRHQPKISQPNTA